ncbi:uncharacterized protein LODBEIA_P52890 [Lodderomyces beijingensis]|uniref:ASTRA-associated protein 1 n=1 Tax=Lodderomyces beijingensis TaxID=1775926 RepID=A0ABP0ZSF6_9ASCO
MRQFSLRAHASPISCILSLSPQQVLTADETGQVITWDLTTRRPTHQWQAHTDAVLTMIPWHNYVITHSRDHTVKFWFNGKLAYEFPINALNYTNIVLLNGSYLVTPATTDSTNIDIYKLTRDPVGITRVIANYSAYETLHSVKNSDLAGRKDFGIIMQMAVIQDEIYIGYESGDIVGLKLLHAPPSIPKHHHHDDESSTSLINKDAGLKLTYHNNSHVPEPVISLADLNGILVSGSTTNTLIVHTDPVRQIKYHGSGIKSVLAYDEELIVAFWDGSIDYHGEIIQRPLPHLNDNGDGDGDGDANDKNRIRLTYMTSLKPIDQVSASADDGKFGRVKHSRAIKKDVSINLLLAGYEDGSIIAYDI